MLIRMRVELVCLSSVEPIKIPGMAARQRGMIFFLSRCFRIFNARKEVITRLLSMQSGTALLISRKRLSSGIATRAEPKPVIPWMKPARRKTMPISKGSNIRYNFLEQLGCSVYISRKRAAKMPAMSFFLFKGALHLSMIQCFFSFCDIFLM